MEEYETAEFAAKYIWNKFVGKDYSRREKVIESLKALINRNLGEQGVYELCCNKNGYMGVIKFFAQEALSDGVEFFKLKITKTQVLDYYAETNEPIFEAGNTKVG